MARAAAPCSQENITTNSVVVSFEVLDYDAGDNGSVDVTFVSSDKDCEMDMFNINKPSPNRNIFEIILKKELDYSVSSEYLVCMNASDRGNPMLVSPQIKKVIIPIEDVQNLGPVFLNLPGIIDMEEDTPVFVYRGQSLICCHVMFMNVYRENKFVSCSRVVTSLLIPGSIRVITEVVGESASRKGLLEGCYVNISLSIVPGNAGRIGPNYSIVLSECFSTKKPRELLLYPKELEDYQDILDLLVAITIHITHWRLGQFHHKWRQWKHNSLQPGRQRAADRKSNPFNCYSHRKDNTQPLANRTTETTIIIRVLDVDDEIPKFDRGYVKVKIYENAPVGTALNLGVTVTDDDEVTNNDFELELVQDLDAFKLKETTSVGGSLPVDVRVKDSAYLDYETRQQLNFTVVVKSNPESKLEVVVDLINENDNTPQFLQDSYEGSFLENATSGYSILSISATDDDVRDNITYKMAPKLNEYVSIAFH
ncbi:putative cadherin-23 [Apostichopus japonicus]|uniref:Putative cadherin-23 n=1 Tax=Stichopus japonicus TaxID=307972 RepID=A0A2G8KF00_STIJA|nr:putative cadherin-23 [Apostichopus japonicus]